MKTRHGFVSNSSTSSFLVVVKDYLEQKSKKQITTQQEKALVKFGFKKVCCFYPDQVTGDADQVTGKDITFEETSPYKTKYYNYGYYVVCNQDDVIYFLIKNKISFAATVHYGHYTYLYKSGAKTFMILQNYGSQAMGWDRKSYKEIADDIGDRIKNPIQEINVKEWMAQEEKWSKEFDNE